MQASQVQIVPSSATQLKLKDSLSWKKAASPADCSLRCHMDQLTASKCKLCHYGAKEVLGYEHTNNVCSSVFLSSSTDKKVLQKKTHLGEMKCDARRFGSITKKSMCREVKEIA